MTAFGSRIRKQKITYLITYPLYDTFMGWQTNPLMGLETRGTLNNVNIQRKMCVIEKLDSLARRVSLAIIIDIDYTHSHARAYTHTRIHQQLHRTILK